MVETSVLSQLDSLKSEAFSASTDIFEILPIKSYEILNIILASILTNQNNIKIEKEIIDWSLSFFSFVFDSGIDEEIGDSRINLDLKKSVLLYKPVKIKEDEEANNNNNNNNNNNKDVILNVLLLRYLNEIINLSCFQSVYIFNKLVQLGNSVFALSFLNVIRKCSDYSELWDSLTIFKASVVSKLLVDTGFPMTQDAPPRLDHLIGPKLKLIKLIGSIIQVQLPTPPIDPRRRNRRKATSDNSNKNELDEISVAMVVGHPLINDTLLAQAKGLLDLLIGILVEREEIVPSISSAINYVLLGLIKKRPSIAPKILSSLATYDSTKKIGANYDKLLSSKQDPFIKINYKINRRFSDRSLKLLLTNLFKNNILTSNKDNNKSDDTIDGVLHNKTNLIHQYQDRQRKEKNLLNDLPEDHEFYKWLHQKEISKNVQIILSNNPKLSKNDLDNINKYYSQVGLNELVPSKNLENLKPIPMSSLYSLTGPSNDLTKFDAGLLNNDILSRLITMAIDRVPSEVLTAGLTIIGERYRSLTNDFNRKNKTSNKKLKLENVNNGDVIMKDQDFDADIEYSLPSPNLLTFEEKKQHVNLIIANYLKLAESKELKQLVESSSDNKEKIKNEDEGKDIYGMIKMSKVAISSWEKNSWAIILIRLATRGLYFDDTTEEESEQLSDLIRQAIFNYFLENIHGRIDIVIDWLNEEWYSESVKCETELIEQHESVNDDLTYFKQIKTPIYIKWTMKIIDSIIPFLESSDRKLFIRLLSDLPYLNEEIILRIKVLCLDNFRYQLGIQTLLYLVLVRPPVKATCLRILMDIYTNIKSNPEKDDDNEKIATAVEGVLKKHQENFKPIE